MPNYAVRVETRENPSAERYESLRALLARQGFQRTVTGVDGLGNSVTVDLPARELLRAINQPTVRLPQHCVVVFVVQPQIGPLHNELNGHSILSPRPIPRDMI